VRPSRNWSGFLPIRQCGRHGDHPGMSFTSQIVDLAERRTGDVNVVLLWSRRSGRVWVTVTHLRSGRTARINATPANALEVFEHPFVYAD
jgi:hypothetical protein